VREQIVYSHDELRVGEIPSTETEPSEAGIPRRDGYADTRNPSDRKGLGTHRGGLVEEGLGLGRHKQYQTQEGFDGVNGGGTNDDKTRKDRDQGRNGGGTNDNKIKGVGPGGDDALDHHGIIAAGPLQGSLSLILTLTLSGGGS